MKRLSGTQLTIVTALVAGLVMLASIAGGDVTSLGNIQLAQSSTGTTYTISPNGMVQYQEYAMSNPSRLVIDLVGVKDALKGDTFQPDGRLITAVRASQFQSSPDLVTRVVFELAEGTHYKVSRKGTDIEVAFTGMPSVMGASMGDAAPATPADGQAVTPAPPAPSAADDTAQPASSNNDAAKAPAAQPAKTDDAAKAPASQPAKTDAKAPAAQPASQPASDAAKAAPEVASATQAKSAWTEVPDDTTPAADSKADTKAGSDNDAAWPEPSDEAVAARTSSNDVVVAQNTPRTVAKAYSTPVFGATLSNQPITIDVQGADIKTVLRSISEFSGVNIVASPDVEGPVVIHLKNVPWKEALDSILKSQGYGWRDDYGIIRVAPVDKLQQAEVQEVTLDRKKEEMQSLVTRVVKLNYLNAEEVKQAMTKVTTPRGSVSSEKGTNSVVVVDVPNRVDKIVAMIKSMDTRLGQVEIVAKMVDVDAEVTRELGVNWEALNLQGGKFAGDVVSGERGAGPFATLRVGTVQSWGDVNLLIDALERENKANIVSNPRVTTADNQEARIMVGQEIPLIVSDEAGNPITELKKIGVILLVTPHVNSDGTITMDLHPELSDLAQQATVQGGVIINLQEADTRVVVKDGETAVIGGLLSETESTLRNGVPILKDMPLLGPLFRFESKTKKKRELVIFVTPKVVSS